MLSSWNSLETLTRIRHYSQIAIIVFSAMVLISPLFSTILSRQISQLNKKQNEVLEGRVITAEETANKNQEELKRVKEKQKTRGISNEQKLKFKSYLQDKPQGEISISITVPLGQPEAFKFAEQLKILLEESGWEKIDGISQAVFNKPFSGILLAVKNGNPALEQAKWLQRGLEEIGINAPGVLNPSLSEKALELKVGNKSS